MKERGDERQIISVLCMDMSLGNLSNINGWWSFHIYIHIYIYIFKDFPRRQDGLLGLGRWSRSDMSKSERCEEHGSGESPHLSMFFPLKVPNFDVDFPS